MGTLLEVKDLRTYFYTADGVVKAVDGISYDVREGETVGLVGESGCGKTVGTLSIMRLVPSPPGRIVGGEVLFNGQDLLKLDAAAMRRIRGRQIAMVFQDPMASLNPVLTIGRQVTEAMELHLGLSSTSARHRAVQLLNVVGISDAEHRLSAYPHQFSGGMRQRVMIAMALSCKPRLIIADEPTTNLDVTIQAQILELMKKLCEDTGTALILITHNLGTVARYADRVNIMYAGKLIERGSCWEIYHNTRHPYTLGLLQSVPRLDAPRKERLSPIAGLPPDLRNLPPQCAFRPRCYMTESCHNDYPPLMRVSDDHLCACWLWDKLGSQPHVETIRHGEQPTG